jgi:hypothetical protein
MANNLIEELRFFVNKLCDLSQDTIQEAKASGVNMNKTELNTTLSQLIGGIRDKTHKIEMKYKLTSEKKKEA